jgi:hypothetical protein
MTQRTASAEPREISMEGVSASAAWLYPIILVAGALQAWGPPMNGALRHALTNPTTLECSASSSTRSAPVARSEPF